MDLIATLGRAAGANLFVIAVTFFVKGGLFGFFGEQSFAVGSRDLIIVGVNFTKGEETMAIAAIFDKTRL